MATLSWLLSDGASNDHSLGHHDDFRRQLPVWDRSGDESYFFSHGVSTYGWGTSCRAFRNYDFLIQQWPAERKKDWLGKIWPVPEIERYWRDRSDETHHGDVDTQDYQWAFAMWRRGGLQITPDRNLISYIGCGPDAVHTKDLSAPYWSLPTIPLSPPMKHPLSCERNLGADLYEYYRLFENNPHTTATAKEVQALKRLRFPKSDEALA